MSLFVLICSCWWWHSASPAESFMSRPAQRRIPMQYARRVVGRRIYGGQTLASCRSRSTPPGSYRRFSPLRSWFFRRPWPLSCRRSRITRRMLTPGGWFYDVIYVALIIFFCYFYTAVTFNPGRCRRQSQEVRRLYSGYPARTLHRRVHRSGAVADHAGRRHLRECRMRPADDPDPAVQRALLFWRHRAADRGGRGAGHFAQMETHLLTRNYEGFMRRGRIKSRRGG